ncbi:MAG: hypothetical protein PHH26_09555 [Candidatus Thermoplasmatota archaeon]|nr:hypothetical protein [Candidatus Thermoplasmatota archaeon]
MTGPGEGKMLLCSKVLLEGKEIKSDVYIHKKGFSGATVTHLDIESPSLNIMNSKGGFFEIAGTGSGIEILIPQNKVRVECSALASVLAQGKRTRTWVGQKQDGIYVGFRREEMLKLDAVAENLRRMRDV